VTKPDWFPTTRERVYDFKGGPLQLVVAHRGPTGAVGYLRKGDPREFVPLSAGLALPAELTFEITMPNESEPFGEVELGVVDGKPAVVAIRAYPGRKLTILALRKLPAIGEIVRLATTDETVRVVRADGELVGEYGIVDPAPQPGDIRLELEADALALLSPRGKRRTIDDEFLRQVAAVYREAQAADQSTQRAIQERLGPTTEANARRWVARARQAGFLGAAPAPRQAGEKPTTRRSR
jgi:hypothetical protein